MRLQKKDLKWAKFCKSQPEIWPFFTEKPYFGAKSVKKKRNMLYNM